MNNHHLPFVRVQDIIADLFSHLTVTKKEFSRPRPVFRAGYQDSQSLHASAVSSTAWAQGRLIVGERGIYKEKKSLEQRKCETAHALGMWLMTTYRRLFSIKMYVKGLENVPPGAKILAANHPNLSDTYLIPLLFSGKVRVLASAKWFRAPVLRWIFIHTGQIPVAPGRRQDAYQLACQALADGDTLLIYPEGRINPDNEKIKICTGAVRMALKSGVPIIPIGIHVEQRDTVKVSPASVPFPCRQLWQVRGKFHLQIGEPWNARKELAGEETSIQVHTLSNNLMEKIDVLRKQAVAESEP